MAHKLTSSLSVDSQQLPVLQAIVRFCYGPVPPPQTNEEKTLSALSLKERCLAFCHFRLVLHFRVIVPSSQITQSTRGNMLAWNSIVCVCFLTVACIHQIVHSVLCWSREILKLKRLIHFSRQNTVFNGFPYLSSMPWPQIKTLGKIWYGTSNGNHSIFWVLRFFSPPNEMKPLGRFLTELAGDGAS